MKQKRFLRYLVLPILAVCLFASCDDELEVTIDDTMLIGYWQAVDNPSEYWRFDAQLSGETWDLSEDVQEGEGTRFNWNTSLTQLHIDLYGEMGQHVFYDYTFTAQTRNEFTWKDTYGNKRTFVRKQL